MHTTTRIALILALSTLAAAGKVSQGPTSGLVTVESAHDFETTYDRLRTAIEGNPNLRVLAEIDHGANAAANGLELPPTRLLVFGNPNLGTPLMRAARTVAIDLPQKFLVWEEDGATFVGYNDPAHLVWRHGIEGEADRLETISTALSNLAAGATE